MTQDSADERLKLLRSLLFQEESLKVNQLSRQLRRVQHQLDRGVKNGTGTGEVDFDMLVEELMEVMPEKMGPAITNTLRTQIRESRDEVVQAIYPIMGQMVKKYVQAEIKQLSEKLDKQLENAFSWDNIKLRLKAMVTGVSYTELMLRNTKEPQVEEIFLVENDSGLLMGSYSRNATLDPDMVAGMLTAIRSFVEDAFEKKGQHLSTIEYETYHIYLQSFHKHYVAIVVSGVMTAEFKDRLDSAATAFFKKIMNVRVPHEEEPNNVFGKYLEESFQEV